MMMHVDDFDDDDDDEENDGDGDDDNDGNHENDGDDIGDVVDDDKMMVCDHEYGNGSDDGVIMSMSVMMIPLMQETSTSFICVTVSKVYSSSN